MSVGCCGVGGSCDIRSVACSSVDLDHGDGTLPDASAADVGIV